jgi:hypothetical protein
VALDELRAIDGGLGWGLMVLPPAFAAVVKPDSEAAMRYRPCSPA